MSLEIRQLTKKYGDFFALKELDVSFEEGIYGILGANGAGKSTFMNLLTDNITRTSGQILWEGTDILEHGRNFRKILGYMPQQQGFYEQFSAKEFLQYVGSLKGLKGKKLREQVDELLDKVNMYSHRHDTMNSFSGGMRQRVLLAQALLGNPKIIILDEPTAGLDPKERINLRNIIAEISQDKIIFIATHVVSDVECIANKVMLMKKGELLRMDSPANLISGMQGKIGEFQCEKKELCSLQEKYPLGNTVQKQNGLFFRIVGDVLPENAAPVTDNISLEDVYLYYCGTEALS